MNMDWLDRFMQGKKKYSAAVILPIIIAVLNVMLAGNPHLDSIIQLVQEFAPTLIALIGGIAYTIVEGGNDKAKIVASNGSAATAAASTMTTSTSVAPTTAVMTTQIPATPYTPPAAAAQPTAPAKVFDAAAFAAEVEEDAKTKYLQANDITRYFAAMDIFGSSKWVDAYHMQAAQDQLVTLALKAFEYKFGFPYTEADKHLADGVSGGECAYYSVANMARQKGVDYWFMLRLVEQTLKNAGAAFNNWAGV